MTEFVAIDEAKILPNAPKWIQLFSLVARRISTVTATGHVACVFAPPVIECFPAAMALASVFDSGVSLERPQEPLGKVASLINQTLQDREHSFNFRADGSKSDEFLGPTKFKPGTFPPVVRLPEHFPHRSDSSIQDEGTERLLLAGFGANLREACWHYFRLCAAPVVIICQNPERIASEVAELTASGLHQWTAEQFSAGVDVGTTPDAWYRRPIICMSPRAGQSRPWLAELVPSAVVVIGYSAWETPARWIWPDVPHTLFLNVRSDDVLRFRMWHDGQVLPEIDSELANLSGVRGIPAKIFAEPYAVFNGPAEFDWEEYGADFE